MTAASATAASARLAAVWRLLALGFAAPSAETIAEVEALAGALEEDATPELAAVLAEAGRARSEELGGRYTRLFRGRVEIPPYEGSYEVDPIRQGRQVADVAGFYRAFGAEAGGPAAERPDYVSCELEFLSFLELRRLAAEGRPEAAFLDEIADAFLVDHAGRWLPTFFAAVQASEPSFYGALGALGARVLADELARRGLEPAALPARGARASVEADAFECGPSPGPP